MVTNAFDNNTRRNSDRLALFYYDISYSTQTPPLQYTGAFFSAIYGNFATFAACSMLIYSGVCFIDLLGAEGGGGGVGTKI